MTSLIEQVQELTKENIGLKEQIFKLKNIDDDELVMVEKVVETEVYGKGVKV